MTTNRWALAAPLGFLLGSCGGGGSGDPMNLPGDDGIASGGACQNEYYQEIIGTYRGLVVFDYVTEFDESLNHCEWEIMARVEVERDLAVCSLRMDTESTVTQDIVLASDDPQRYQCLEENGVRSLNDPNQSSSPSSFNDVTFPVFVNVEGELNLPRRGPYFDDPSVDAEYLYLFDGIAEIADGVRFDGAGGLELFQRAPPDGETLSGILVKE